MTKKGRIYYLAGDASKASGGEKHTYDHVDILNAAGFEAYVLHSRPGYRHTWFDNNTPVIDYRSFWKVYDKASDYIVLPESFGHNIMRFPGKKIIFNKSLYIGFGSFGLFSCDTYPYLDESVTAIFAVSEHNIQHLKFAFPKARIFRMYTHIDCKLFAYRPPALKKPIIACVVKALEPLTVLYHMLRARGLAGLNCLSQYEWVFLQGYSQREIARLLGDALVVISLNTFEGLPRILLEAMACGCLVVAYGSGPLKECLPVESRFDSDNLLRIAEQIEFLTSTFPVQAEQWTSWSAAGRQIAETYSLERQRDNLVRAWEQITAPELSPLNVHLSNNEPATTDVRTSMIPVMDHNEPH